MGLGPLICKEPSHCVQSLCPQFKWTLWKLGKTRQSQGQKPGLLKEASGTDEQQKGFKPVLANPLLAV